MDDEWWKLISSVNRSLQVSLARAVLLASLISGTIVDTNDASSADDLQIAAGSQEGFEDLLTFGGETQRGKLLLTYLGRTVRAGVATYVSTESSSLPGHLEKTDYYSLQDRTYVQEASASRTAPVLTIPGRPCREPGLELSVRQPIRFFGAVVDQSAVVFRSSCGVTSKAYDVRIVVSKGQSSVIRIGGRSVEADQWMGSVFSDGRKLCEYQAFVNNGNLLSRKSVGYTSDGKVERTETLSAWSVPIGQFTPPDSLFGLGC